MMESKKFQVYGKQIIVPNSIAEKWEQIYGEMTVEKLENLCYELAIFKDNVPENLQRKIIHTLLADISSANALVENYDKVIEMLNNPENYNEHETEENDIEEITMGE